MEVSSSTTTSTPQDAANHMLPDTPTVTTTLTTPVGSTSSAEPDGLNNMVSTDIGMGRLEVPVPYGPALPPSFYPMETMSYSKDVRDAKAVHGSCGLYNLGNTCFMNAGLQSLISCAPLVKFFCENYMLTESSKNTLTGQFFILLCKMWSGQFSVVHPRKFKEFLGFYHSQFEDYRQHDCQEFLAVLLDTLHEQLNNAVGASKHSYSPSPLPVTSTCTPLTFHETCGPAAVTTTSNVESCYLAAEEQGRDDDDDDDKNDIGTVDLNNKDSDLTVINQEEDEEDSSECKNSSKFSSLAHPLTDSDSGQSPSYHTEGSPASEVSALDSIVTSPSSQRDSISHKSPEHVEEEEVISSSFPPLRRYTSRSNLDDVSSSDSGIILKPSLKRVSSGSSVTACGLVLHSEDSNHSSVSAHSTDSEQSSAFKRLKIDAVEMNRNANNNLKDCVTSSSDCKKSSRSRKNMLGENSVLRDSGEVLVTSNVAIPSPHKDLNVIDNMVSSCQDPLCVDVDVQSTGPEEQPSPGMPCLEDFYRKETKTLNTNVLSSGFVPEMTSDSEKFAKVDNRSRPPSKEINILQEAFGEEDKAEKVLIGLRLSGVKDTNLYAQSAVGVVKPVKNADPNILNNSLDRDVIAVEAMSKFVPTSTEVMTEENNLPLKLLTDGHKIDEEEKNVQMQAYAKFNTIPERSNIRTDLTDTVDPDRMEVDEPEVESSDDDELENASHNSEIASHTSTVEECSSVPNCLRHCAPSEVMMANRAWDEYLVKNDSVVVSTFQGQFRSTVVCSECSHVSVTYEPFMYLSLPIPHAMEQQICIVYISQHKPPVKYLLNLLKTDKIGTAKKKLCEMIGQEDSDIVMAEVLDSHISRILDDNILLKYVNTFNRKIYAFEVISADSAEAQAGDTLSCDQLLNNEESPSLQHDFELPSSSREELPYVTDSQMSNQSFDSINVNSPSSRDTLDYMFSDSEVCEPSSREHPEFSPSCFKGDDDETSGECQSTSGMREERGPWVCGEYSGNQGLSWNIDNENDDDTGVCTKASPIPSSSSPSGREDHVNSCTSGDWLERSGKGNHEGSWEVESNTSGGETVVNETVNSSEAASSENVYDEEQSPEHHERTSPHVYHSVASNSKEEAVTISKSEAHVSKCSTVTTTSSVTTTISINNNNNSSHFSDHQHSSGSNNSHGGSSRNPSRSCPSPKSFAHTSEPEATLLGVAAKLEESPGSYFLNRPHGDDGYGFYPDEGTSDVTGISCTFDEEKPREECEDSNWSSFPVHNQSVSESQSVSMGPLTDQWRSCAICLEDLMDTELLTHVMCDGVFCQNCLDMSVKHAADVSAFCCPICLQPANMCEDFVPLASTSAPKPKIRTLPMSIAYRHNVQDNTGSESLELFGHPNILHMPSVLSGGALYSLVDRLVSPLLTTYVIMLTDGQGLTCSRCTYSRHCSGCEIAREGEITLQPSDCLTVHVCDTLSHDQVCDLQYVHEDSSMAGLRSSEPTTIKDCFGAFTQSEILDEHNPWYCPQCERNQCAKKTMTVWRYPDNLIIHLKRFVFQDLASTKVDTKVIFPQNDMDVRCFLSGPSSTSLVYDLYSIVCHFGGASAGHYTCYTKHPLTKQWYYYNDETVTPQMPSESEYSSGYVLFYQRKGTDVDFTPPTNLSCFEDDPADNGAASSSNFANRSHSAGQSSSSCGNGNTSMAVVLFQPQATSSQEPDNKTEEDEDDDYDNERRCSPCDDESLTVHFGSIFPDPHDHFGDDHDSSGDGRGTHIVEPDSTLDFYS